MALNWLYYTIGSVLIATAVFAIIVAISARKIDFGDRLFDFGKRLEKIREPKKVGSSTSRGKFKGRRSKSARPQPTSSDSFREEKREKMVAEEESEAIYEDALTGPSPGSGYAPKTAEVADFRKATESFDDEVEMVGEAEMLEEAAMPEEADRFAEVEEEVAVESKEEVAIIDDMSRDLSIQLPRNMCLDEVFRLKITLLKSKEFKDALTIKELEVDKTEAEYYALTAKKLGEKITEATTRIEGLSQGAFIVRPIALGNVAVVSPGQRTVYFDPAAEEIVVEFFLTPTKWSKDLDSNLKIEFEQHYHIIRSITIPVKIYKRKLEAIFGFNLSRWQTYALYVYSAFGTISSLIAFFNENVVDWFNNLSSL